MPAARSFATRALVALVALSAVALVCAQATAPSRPVKPTCEFAKPDASKCEAWKAKLDVMVPALCKNRAEKVETDLEERIHAARSAYFFRKAEAVTQYEREILDPSTEKLAAMKRDAKLKEFRAKRDQRTKTAKAWAKVRGKQAADECENQKKFLRLQLELNCTPKVCKERSCPWATAMRQHARDVCRFEREQARANRTQALNTVRADYRARLADLRETEGKIRAQHTSTEGVVTYLSDAGKLAMKNVRAQRADARRTRAKKEREVRIAYRAAKRASRVRCKARRAKAQKRFAFVCTAVTPQPTDAQRLIRQQARAAFKAALKAKANSNKLAKQARDLKRATAKSAEKAKPTTAAAAAAAAVKAANAKERLRRAAERREAAKAAAAPPLPAATAAPTVKA